MATFLDLPNALRNTKRYVEILAILVRHGFGDVVQTAHLDRLISGGDSALGGETYPHSQHTPKAVRLCRVMEELGPTFIKLGQVLSTRPDLVPPDWANEFSRLQSNCAPIPFEAIRERLSVEYEGKIDAYFKSIEAKPLATASIAQVHRAILTDGTPLLLKIVRPGIQEVLESDFAILHTLAELTENHFSNLGYSPTEVVREFKKSIGRELDLVHEGRATDRFRVMFAEDSDVVFPRIYWHVTTKSVLGVEEIKGQLLSTIDYTSLTTHDRRALVTNGARAVFRQCLEEGFFHADPHPGNLFALSEGRIAFIDCGMTGQLDSQTLEQLGELVAGVVAGDIDRVTRVVALLADVEPSKTDERSFRADVREFVAHFEHAPLGSMDMGALLKELFDKIRSHGLRCPADLVLLLKALTTIESIGKDLDPTFDMVAFVGPYMTRLVSRRLSVSALTGRTRRSLGAYLELIERLPFDAAGLLDAVRRKRVSVNLEHRGLRELTATVEHASRNISFALIIAALLVSSAILVLADRGSETTTLTTIGLSGFGFACLILLIKLVRNRPYK